MAKTTGKKRRETREEAVPKYSDFMPRVGIKRLLSAIKHERPGKPQIILHVCELQKKGNGDTAHNKKDKAGVFDRARLAAPHDGCRPGQAV